VNVLIISASMGAGHDGAAHELARRLEADGHETDVRDYLSAFPLGIGRLVRRGYQLELRLAPWGYEATYRLWLRLPSMAAPLVALLTLVTGFRVRRWARGADAVVSTYPLASLVLGRLRATGRLDVPVSNYITDFAVHTLWAAPGMDLHMAVHPQAAQAAHDQAGGAAVAPGPLVGPRFTEDPPSRAEARARLGIPPDPRIALLVAGSWGVGALRRTFEDIVATGRWSPVVVCGRNERLRRDLSQRGVGLVLGWTDEMPALMAAADALVENAGGLTCMEAFSVGLPVVTYRPIAGHGKGNAREMVRAGVASLAEPGELAATLDATLSADGRLRREAGLAMFAADPARVVSDLAAARRAPVIPLRRPRARRVAVTAAASVAAAVAFTAVGAPIAAAHGLAVAHPPHGTNAAYLGIRLGTGATADPSLPAAIATTGITAIVSGQLADSEPTFVGSLAAAGVDVANGGWGVHHGMVWTRTAADVARSADAIHDATGDKVRIFAPGQHVSGFALVSAEWSNQRVVLTRDVLPPAASLPDLRPGGVYLLDARTMDGAQLRSVLAQVRRLQAGGQLVLPLSALRG
jgi:processive 1,2-diacylglycerol beta-glucosyltransferase